MTVKRNQRTLPLTLKPANEHPLNANIVSAYDYADGNGAPHVGTLVLGHNGSPSIVSLNGGEILARDPSQGKTVITPYNNLTVGSLGFGDPSGKGAWTVWRRYRAPSAYSGTSANREIAVYRDGTGASGNRFSIWMVESISNPWCFFFIDLINIATTLPPAGTRDSSASLRIPYGSIVDLHITRNGDTVKFYLNGVLVSTLAAPTFSLYNTNWTGLKTNDGIAAGNANDLLLIDHVIWNAREYSAAEVTQHQADPYAGYVNSATPTVVDEPDAPTSPVATAGQGSISVIATPGANNGSAITSYTVNVYAVDDNAVLGANSGSSFPIIVSGLPTEAAYAKVFATNGIGNSPESAASNTVTPTAAPAAPAAPTAPVATAGQNSISVTATPGANGSSAITGFTVKVYAADDNTLLGSSSGGALPIVVTGLPVRSAYAKVLATNSVGNGPESVASNTVTPSAPAATPVRFDFPASYAILAPSVEAPSDITSVAVQPSNVSMDGGAVRQFTATVVGTNSPNTAVTWSATGGAISASGTFTAPAATSSEQSILVRATSVQDPRKWAEATVSIAAVQVEQVTSVSVTPSMTVMAGGETKAFSAAVVGPQAPSQEVTWTTTGGSINAAGDFTAPQAEPVEQSITVRATSVQDPAKWGEAGIVIPALVIPVIDSVVVTPPEANVAGGGKVQFAVAVLGENSPSQEVTWTTSLGQISATGELTAPSATMSVQTGTVTATSKANGAKSGSATFTVPAEIPVATRTVSIRLGTEYGPAANLDGIMVSFHAATGPHNTLTALYQSDVESTDDEATLTFSMQTNAIGVGALGLLSILMPDGRHYLGLVEVS